MTTTEPAPTANGRKPPPEARKALARLKRVAEQIAAAEARQRGRLAERYDLAQAAREAGATWPQINGAAGVANMQATINGKRPEV
jgi:hypothetical protein